MSKTYLQVQNVLFEMFYKILCLEPIVSESHWKAKVHADEKGLYRRVNTLDFDNMFFMMNSFSNFLNIFLIFITGYTTHEHFYKLLNSLTHGLWISKNC